MTHTKNFQEVLDYLGYGKTYSHAVVDDLTVKDFEEMGSTLNAADVPTNNRIIYPTIETETMNELTATAVPVLTGSATLSDDTKAIVDSLAAGTYQIGNMLAKSSWGDDIILKRNPHTSEYDKEFRINESLVSEMNDLVRVVKGLSQSREGACTAQWATQSLLERKED